MLLVMTGEQASMRIAVVSFPGTTCDDDMHRALSLLGVQSLAVRSDVPLPSHIDAVILPGGFSFGDALRPGALAASTPILQDIQNFVVSGGPVLGICNGFQVLCEAKLLPGALLANQSGRFVCKSQALQASTTILPTLADSQLQMPIAHAHGRYYADAQTLHRLSQEGRIALRYTHNPNGSLQDIAGIADNKVWGLMPHPERACEESLGSTDGLRFLRAFLSQ